MDERSQALRAARIMANRYVSAPRSQQTIQAGDVVQIGAEFWAIRYIDDHGLRAWSFSTEQQWPHTAPRDVRRSWIVLRRLRVVPHRRS